VSAAADDKLPREVWIVSGVVVSGVIMSILDTTIVNVALETLARELKASLDTIRCCTPTRAGRTPAGSIGSSWRCSPPAWPASCSGSRRPRRMAAWAIRSRGGLSSPAWL
jgi:hypothetical protein